MFFLGILFYRMIKLWILEYILLVLVWHSFSVGFRSCWELFCAKQDKTKCFHPENPLNCAVIKFQGGLQLKIVTSPHLGGSYMRLCNSMF
jgi:hypothetical protein